MKCVQCGGKGVVRGGEFRYGSRIPCPSCKGAGMQPEPCDLCRGWNTGCIKCRGRGAVMVENLYGNQSLPQQPVRTLGTGQKFKNKSGRFECTVALVVQEWGGCGVHVVFSVEGEMRCQPMDLFNREWIPL